VQDEIAKAVTHALALKLLPNRPGPAARPATDPEAYRLYLLARQLMQLGTVEAYDRAIAALRQAGRTAPDDARVRAQLAFLLWQRAVIGTGDMKKPNAEALATADQAVALGPDLPDTYLVRGFLRHMTTWDWSAARNDEERALALAPGDVVGRTNFARLLATTGKLGEAVETMTRVIEADPLSPNAWLWMGVLQSATGHPEKAEVSFHRGLDLAPNHAYLLRELGFALLLQNRPKEALAIAERHPVEWMRWILEAMAHHRLGDDGASRRALEHLSRVGTPASYQLAQVHAWRGEKDRAFEWLERGYETDDSGMRFTIHDPMIAGLRGDPRFGALLGKMNLPVE
jgi:tetratricopeptide (TPR) repeat protein